MNSIVRFPPFDIRLLLLLFCLLNVGGALAQEARFKALFIYKFVDYVQWPDVRDEVVIGVYGSDQIFEELQTFAQSKAGVKVVSVNASDELMELHMFYVPSVRVPGAARIIAALSHRPVLIISDTKESLESGADIGFFLQDGKLRFALKKKLHHKKEADS